MRGVPEKYVPRVQAFLQELESQGYLPKLSDSDGTVEQGQPGPRSGANPEALELDLPELPEERRMQL